MASSEFVPPRPKTSIRMGGSDHLAGPHDLATTYIFWPTGCLVEIDPLGFGADYQTHSGSSMDTPRS